MIITKDDRNYFDIGDLLHTANNTYSVDNAEKLGVGGNAVVYECTDRQGNGCAIKLLLNLSGKSCKRFKQEIDVLLKLDHPHIVKYIDNGEVNAKRNKSENVTIPFLIMEKAEMNIVDFMRKNGEVGYDIYAPQIRGLADALKHLHAIAIHRDIKPENILIKGETWLLSDFGLCTAVESDERIDVTKSQERIGPKYWLSPEATDKVYFGVNDIDEKSDVYQLSAVFWFVITRRYPLGLIDEDDYAGFDKNVCQELLGSLKYNKTKRTTSAEVLYDNICNATINKEKM
jgi:serine/threonine-protein kinase